MAEIKLTSANFEEEVKNSDIPVLVDFWAPWCGPCQMLGPVIEEIAEEYDGRMKVGKVNTDDEPALAAAHSISSIPAVLMFVKGEVVDRSVGYVPKDELAQMFEKYL
ncbi:MAG: thioredoxin [Eubacterium sp.]|nr:thioredoxin [Eubacterium sp.]